MNVHVMETREARHVGFCLSISPRLTSKSIGERAWLDEAGTPKGRKRRP